jgi:hypothetical protein
MEWHVVLSGVAEDLARVAELTAGLPVRVEQSGTEYRLQSPEFADLVHAPEVHAKAAELMALVNSAAALDDRAISALTVVDVYWTGDDGHRVHTLILEAEIAPRGQVITFPNAPHESATTLALRHVANPNLREALAHLAEDSWYGIYKVIESIENELGSEAKLLAAKWIPASEVKLLKRTANGAAGQQTRHAAGKFDPPKYPMPYGVARANARILIQALAEHLARVGP